MGQDSQPISSSVFSINVSANNEDVVDNRERQDEPVVLLLQQLLDGQERQNELLQEMIESMNASQRQRSAELGQWKQSNPQLSDRCRKAAEILNAWSSTLQSISNQCRQV